MGRHCRDPEAQEAALALLRRGLATLGEAAQLTGVSPQLVRQWALAARLDWKQARRKRLEGAWRKRKGQQILPSGKPALRKISEAIQRDLDAQHNGPDELE